MTTTMKQLRFGIEIETVGLGRRELAEAIRSVVGGEVGYEDVVAADGRRWRVVPDGSLSGGERSGEIVSPILGYDDIATLQEVVRAVRRAGARADQSCGIHLHVDAAAFGAHEMVSLVRTVYKQERLVEAMLGVSEARLGRYCRSIDEGFMARLAAGRMQSIDDVKTAWYGRRDVQPSRYHDSRYRGLNLNSYFYRRTVEYRYFNGTLHAGEVKAYIQFVLALTAKGLSAKAASATRRTFKTGAPAAEDARIFLKSALGLIGEEFATARLHLTKRLAGAGARRAAGADRE